MKTLSKIAALLFLVTPAFGQTDDIKAIHQQMLYPVFQVQAERGTGSGTVIYSSIRNTEIKTLVLTNYHVIEANVSYREEFDPEQGKDVKKRRFSQVSVAFFDYINWNKFVGTSGKVANIVAVDKDLDLALLELEDNKNFVSHVATILPEGSRLDIGETTYAVGAGLGRPPFISQGILGFLHEKIEGQSYMLSTAPIIFGNSGGALFRRNPKGEYEMIGVPSRVTATGFGGAVTHMGWSLPTKTIRAFLRANKYGYVLNDVAD